LYISSVAIDDQSMTEAICGWLAARKIFFANGGDGLDAYSTADLNLLAAFVADWSVDDPRVFAKAYQTFRASLIANANGRSANPPRDHAGACDEA
jgi:hypothetical protein